MRALFVHQNYPAQFGHIAQRLAARHGWECIFVSRVPPGEEHGVRRIQYQLPGGATKATHYCSRTFENAIWHAHSVYEACRTQLSEPPDLIVGHSGFGSTLFLRELYPCPILNYFEFYYHPHNSDMDFRPDFPPAPIDFLRAQARNAMLLLDLQNCDAGYSPTEYQRSLFPAEYHPRMEVIFDGIDTEIWRRRLGVPRILGKRRLDASTRVVTYVSRGLESMRGFDIFMQVARRIYEEHPDVLFVVVGSDRICYGGDERHIQAKNFKEHVVQQGEYDLSRFIFAGNVPQASLARLFSLSDLHIYLTVPFVLSWSLFNALSCECTVLASNTPPVLELVKHGENGLLGDFFDVNGLARQALEVLRSPDDYRRRLGKAGSSLIREKYSLEQCLPKLEQFYRSAGRRPEAENRTGTD